MVKNKIRFDSMIHSSPTHMAWHGRAKSQISYEPKLWSTKVERNIAVQCTGHWTTYLMGFPDVQLDMRYQARICLAADFIIISSHSSTRSSPWDTFPV